MDPVNPAQRRKPAYLVISDALRQRIENNELRPGDRFPTERELVREFDVARMTVRHALDVLQLEGLIDRRRGRTGGTFVKKLAPTIELTRMEGIGMQFERQDQDMEIADVTLEQIPAPHLVSQALGIEEEEPVWELRRNFYIDEVKTAVAVHHLPTDLFAHFDDRDLSGALHDVRDFKRETVTALMPNAALQAEFEIGRSLPLLKMTRSTYNADNRCVEYVEILMRSDTANVEVLVGTPPEGNPHADKK